MCDHDRGDRRSRVRAQEASLVHTSTVQSAVNPKKGGILAQKIL